MKSRNEGLHSFWGFCTHPGTCWHPPRVHGPPLRSLGVLWGGVSKQENKGWVIKKREGIWRGPEKLSKEQQRPLICPVGPFTSDNDNNHFQRANYFLGSVLFTLCTLLLIYTTTLQVRTVYTTTLQVMPLSPVGNLKCREVIQLSRPRSLRSGALQWSRSLTWGRRTHGLHSASLLWRTFCMVAPWEGTWDGERWGALKLMM